VTKRILLTGATGYIGGRLLPRLLEKRLAVRVLVRDPAHVTGRAWAPMGVCSAQLSTVSTRRIT
jgi:uncharacterized protein YbjT (DUF2867 family)